MADICDYKSKFIFTWNIENFFAHFLKKDTNLLSPVFTIEAFDNSKWQILLFFQRTGFYRSFREVHIADNVVSLSCNLQRNELGESCAHEQLEIIYNVEVIGSSRKLLPPTAMALTKFGKGDQVKLFSNLRLDKPTSNIEKSSGDLLTIRLTMLGKELIERRRTECIACTKVGSDQCSFEWKFSKKNFLQTKTFSCFPGMRIELQINSETDESVKVVVQKTDENLANKFLLCIISFIDINGTKIGSTRSTHWFDGPTNEFRFQVDITKNFLKQQFSTYGCVTLLCDCYLSNGTLLSEMRYIQSDASVDTTIPTLQNDLQRMYLEKILSDVKLNVCGEIFLAHKCVLCARSVVFLTMFSQDMSEYKTNMVYISDIDPKTFALFLEFLYLGKTDLKDWESALKLLLCADKYQVPSLKENCSTFLMANLCETNACNILIVADMTGMELLKSSVIRRIGAHASRIFRLSEWIEILENHAKLATEVLSVLSFEISQ